MQILAVLFAAIGVISFFVFTFYSSIYTGLISLISILAVAGVLYTLGQIADDVRDINNILRNAFPDKIPTNEEEKLQQKVCPVCGTEHDFDSPKCPHCGAKA